jgi:general secretion pathway protein A
MYVNHFGFREKPFNVTPDPRFVYMNPAYQEAYANLLAGIRERKGFIVLTGEVGTGKTTLLRMLMRNLEATVRFVYFYNTTLSFEELLTFACEELRLEVGSGGRLKKIQALNDFLIEQLRRGGTGALLIDEAQHLSEHVLENLRLLSNLETGTEKLLQIVLVGQPELEAKLAQPSLRQLKQRVSALCRIDRLKDREIQPYIHFRLESVGYAGKELFDKTAIQAIARYSNGIPRLINILCDNALTIAYATTRRAVSGDIIEEVATDLRLAEPVVAPAPVAVATPAPAPTPAPPPPPASAPSAASTTRREPAPPRSQPVVAPPPAVPRRERREARGRRSFRPVWIAAAGLAALAAIGGTAAIAGPRLARMGEAMASSVVAAGRVVVSRVTQALDAGSSTIAAPPARPVPDAGASVAAEATPADPRTGAGPVAAPGIATAVVSPVAPAPEPVRAPSAPAPAPPVAGPPPVERPVSPAAPPRPAPAAAAAPAARPAAAAAPAVTPAPAPVAPPPPARRMETRVASAPAGPPARDQRPMLIPQGGTISDIAFRTYGHYSTLAVDLIKESNPHISDLDWIRAGDRLWLPPLTAETLIRPQPDGSYRLVLASFLSSVAAERLSDGIRRRGYDARVIPRQVTGQLALYRVEIAGVGSRDAAESAWRAAVANCWVFIADAPCERTNP